MINYTPDETDLGIMRNALPPAQYVVVAGDKARKKAATLALSGYLEMCGTSGDNYVHYKLTKKGHALLNA